MTFLPVAERELRVAARRKTTYRIRFGAAFVALLVSGWIYGVSGRFMQPSMLGAELFATLAWLAFIYTLLTGTRVTADCLSEEKREGTLGLLFLTDLKGYDVVLGKLAATSMNTVYGLLAIVPVLALPLLMGGVGLDWFWRAVLVLLNTLFVSLTAGLMVSASCRHERKAMGGTFLLLLLLNAGPPALGACCEYYTNSGRYDPDFIRPFLIPSPTALFAATMSPGRVLRGVPRDFWWSVLFQQVLGWCFLLLASYLLPRAWQDRPTTSRGQKWRGQWQRWCYGNSEYRRILRAELLEVNPFLWLSRRDRLQQSFLWGFLGLLGVGFFWGYLKWRQDWLSVPTAIAAALILHATLKCWTASDAARRFGDIRREEALEQMVCTALTVEEILQGQRLAFRRLFGWPLALILMVDLLLLWMGLGEVKALEDRRLLIAVFAAGMVTLVADYHALIWVGLWLGLATKNYKAAGGETIGRILLLPWIAWYLSITFYFAFVGTYTRPEPHPFVLIMYWTMLGLGADWLFGSRAYRKLHGEFFSAATRRFQPPPRRRFLWFLR